MARKKNLGAAGLSDAEKAERLKEAEAKAAKEAAAQAEKESADEANRKIIRVKLPNGRVIDFSSSAHKDPLKAATEFAKANKGEIA